MAVIGGTEIVASYGLRGSGGVASINGLTGAVIFAAGTGITLTPAGNTVTIAATGGSGATVVASGTAALGVLGIATLSSAAPVTVAAAGVLSTDSIEWAFNAAPGTGYSGTATSGLFVLAYVSAGAVNFLVVNPTAGGITPPAATLNWRVIR